MIKVTEAATAEFNRYFESRTISAIRIFFNAGG